MSEKPGKKRTDELDLDTGRADRFVWDASKVSVDNTDAVGERIELFSGKDAGQSTASKS